MVKSLWKFCHLFIVWVGQVCLTGAATPNMNILFVRAKVFKSVNDPDTESPKLSPATVADAICRGRSTKEWMCS